jgi:glycosyltransferase involved in cell wall biosynthesis
MGGGSTPLPRLLVVKGTFEQFGGAERDLLNNLPAWSNHFDVILASLNLPDTARTALDEVGIPYLTPALEWEVPRGGWAEFRAKASRQAGRRWLSMLEFSEQGGGLREVLANVDAIHVTSGVGSLEFTGLAPTHLPLHYHCLEPHRGLYEDVLHRTLNGTPKRNLTLTHLLLGKQRNRDRRAVQRLDKRKKCTISGNSRWIQERISLVYGIESGILLPTVDLSVWESNSETAQEKGDKSAVDDTDGNGETDSDYVVTIGGASYVKGTWDTLEMVAGSGLSLALVGGGSPADLGKLRTQAKKLAVELNVQPRLSQQELVDLVIGARAVVSLAREEPFGLTPIEAQAAGTPALMVDEGGFRYTVEDGVSGRLLPRGDWSAWHNALEESANTETRAEWANAGRENIERMGLAPEHQAAALAEILFPMAQSTEEE